jgi:acetyl esterase/lipase
MIGMSESNESADVLALSNTPDAIELRHLRAFVAVAEELNFGRAASRLYLSQPALSRQIRALERLLGCDLLRRSTHRVELTLAGEALLDRTRTLLADLDSALVTARSVGGELVGRANRLWAPVATGRSDGGQESLTSLRAAYEQMLAQAPVPPDVVVLPLTCGGVPALQVAADASLPPTVLHLHGGGFVMGSAYGYRGFAGVLATCIGSGVLVPDYRLAPEHPYPAAVDDAVSAYLWMLEQVPADQLIVSGDSGGGALALSLLLALRDRGHLMPAGAVLLCPGVDMTEIIEGTSPLAEHENFGMLAQCVEWYVAGQPTDDPLLDPMNADLAGLPPLLIQLASGDPVAVGARQLAERAEQQGVEVTTELYAVDTHIFQLFWSFLPEAQQAMAKVGEFTERLLGPGRASKTV